MMRVFPREKNLLAGSSFTYSSKNDSPYFEETAKERPKSLAEPFGLSDSVGYRVFGHIYQWRKIGEMGMTEGSHLLADNVSVQIRKIREMDDGTRERRFHLDWSMVRLKTSADRTRNYNQRRWDGMATYVLVAEHEELDEAILLKRESANLLAHNESFNVVQTRETEFRLEENPKWRIIWPKSEVPDALDKWLSEAKMSVYLLYYVGRLDQTVN